MQHNYPKTIKAAALILDNEYPGWANKIDTSTLDMEDGTKCILGQLYEDYYTGVIKLFNCYEDKVSRDGILGIKTNKQKWINEINSRLVSTTRYLSFKEAISVLSVNQKCIYHKDGYILNYDYNGRYFIEASKLSDEWTTTPSLRFDDLKPGDKFQFIGDSTECIRTDYDKQYIFDTYKVNRHYCNEQVIKL